jgi:hypothetical protein
MRRARDHVGAHIAGQVEMVALQVRDQQRGARRPPFMFAVGLDDARAGRIEAAALHQPIAPAAEGIVQGLVGERERVRLPGRVLRVPRIASGQAEADIGRHATGARDMRHQPVEHHSAGEVLVEAEIEEIAQISPGLRHAKADRALHRAAAGGEGIGWIAAAAKK